MQYKHENNKVKNKGGAGEQAGWLFQNFVHG
jgi:hypothetical protein